jgi:hypothetical protein
VPDLQDPKGKLYCTVFEAEACLLLPIAIRTSYHLTQIKCDETKPCCLKCTTTGRKCDGYVLPPPRKARNQVTIVSSAQSQLPDPTKGLALVPITASSSELRALEYFCVKTAPNMGMHFDADFWKRFVVPASMAEPALRHAMVAVGIFAQQRAVPNDEGPAVWWPDVPSTSVSVPVRKRAPDGNSIVALSNYNKSIGLLTKLASSSPGSNDVVLLACVLFICVELLRGDDVAAIQHFRGGMTIITDSVYRANNSTATGSKLTIGHVNDSILPVFNRLEMLFILFGNDASWPYPVPLTQTIPATFSSVAHARDSMVHLMNLSLRFVRTVQLLEYDPCATPVSAYDEQAALLRYLSLWRSRFSAFQTCRAHGLIPDDLYAANVLGIQWIVAYTWISTVMDPFQCAHDAHLPAYTAAVVLAEELATFATTRDKPARKANNFLLDVEIVGPVYYVSIKCREPSVRRRAIAVLGDMQRREGLWDSKVAAAVARRVVAVEEASLDERGWPTEEVRVHSLPFTSEADMGLAGGVATFMTKPFGVYEDWVMWEEQIPFNDTGSP